MTERSNAVKQKRGEGAKGADKGSAEAALAAENARLAAELVAAQARISELEQKHAEVINRIDWVIDSLHNLSE